MSDKTMLMFCCLLASLPVWTDTQAQGPIDELRTASKSGDVETVRRLLIDEEVDLNEDKDGRALLNASAHNHLTIVELLLVHGADPAKKGNGICSALGYAVREGYQDIVRILLDNGAQATALDCHMRCPKLTTPLHLAVLEGNCDMVKLLCEYPTPLEKSLIN